MKHCNHTNWIRLSTYGNEIALLETDRLQKLTNHIPNPDVQKPSLLVLIGDAAKSIALRELFGVKKARWFKGKPAAGKIHLHLDSSSNFARRPLLVADIEFPKHNLRDKADTADKCHETTRRVIRRDGQCLNDVAGHVYTHLLFPFVDIFCFFSADLGGFRQTARHIAAWLERGTSSTLPRGPSPRLVVVTDKIPPGATYETEARNAFLWMLGEETTKDPFEWISAIDIVVLVPDGRMSADARHRLLKERLLDGSDQMQNTREDTRTLFTMRHFGAFFRHACQRFAKTYHEPFDFIKASRTHNPVASGLGDHLSTFLKHIKTPSQLTDFAVPMIASTFLLDNYPPGGHLFDPADVFPVLYKDALFQACGARVMAFERSNDVVLRSGFIDMVEACFRKYFEQLIQESKSAVEIHSINLERLKDRWHDIRSDSTCFLCLRRRPQHNLHCGHCICQMCVVNLGQPSADDPWEYEIHRCRLCGKAMPEKMVVKIHPPTSGVGILCLDGGGVRGVIPLGLMKRLQDCIGLPIPFQKFFKIAFGISSGGLIVLAMFLNGWSVDHSTETFERLAKQAFKRRKVLDLPFFSRLQELLTSFFADGLYSAHNIETALQEIFGIDRSILDCSYATSTGTRIGVPVATVQNRPSCKIFTNYNGDGDRSGHEDNHIVKPKDGFGRVPVWEIARSASAAPGFFPPKKIDEVGTFQDPGPLENDPLVSALYEAAAAFPSVEEPDFILSLGTGEPKPKIEDMLGASSRSVLRNGALPRLCRMFWEKMRDKKVRQAFRTHPRYHRLDPKYDNAEFRLDDVESIPELKSIAQDDDSLSNMIEDIARCMVASLFYFELGSKPDKLEGKDVGYGYIQCSIRRNSPAFSLLLKLLSSRSAVFYLDEDPLPGEFEDPDLLGPDGNFRMRVELDVASKFTISLKQSDSEPRHISGSPYSIDKLISAQGLDAYLGTADHRKRKRLEDDAYPARKKQRRI